MAVRPRPIKPDEARELIAASQASERAIAKRAAPPVWFSVATAIVFGGVVAAVASGVSELVALGVVGFAGLIAARYSKLPFAPRATPRRLIEAVALAVFILGALLVIAAGRLAREAYGISWAPLMAGCAAGGIVLALALVERSKARKDPGPGKAP